MTLAGALAVVLAVHRFAFTIYRVPAGNIAYGLHTGDRVMVNRLARPQISRGDYIVYTDSTADYLAQVTAVPGDTVVLNHERYVMPQKCCKRCGCTDCKYYLISASGRRHIIHSHLIVGRANRIYHLPF